VGWLAWMWMVTGGSPFGEEFRACQAGRKAAAERTTAGSDK